MRTQRQEYQNNLRPFIGSPKKPENYGCYTFHSLNITNVQLEILYPSKDVFLKLLVK